MTIRFRRAAVALAVATLAFTGLTACGSDEAADSRADEPALSIDDAWVRATVGAKDTTMTSAFMVLTNNTDAPWTITAASSDVAETSEFHDMTEMDGQMMMMKMEHGITLKPQTGAILQPGGKHVMLMGMKKQLKAGDEVTFTLTYDNGKTATVTAPVKDSPEEEGHYHAPADGSGAANPSPSPSAMAH